MQETDSSGTQQLFENFVLPNGTELIFQAKAVDKEYRVILIAVVSGGWMQKVEQFDLSPFLPAEGE